MTPAEYERGRARRLDKLCWQATRQPKPRPPRKKRVRPYLYVPVASVGGHRVEYPSIQHAADALGVSRNAVVDAIRSGHRCRGRRWTWANPRPGAAAQPAPIKPRHRVQNVTAGQTWLSLMAAAGGDKATWMAMRRAIDRGRPWNGMVLRIVGEGRGAA